MAHEASDLCNVHIDRTSLYSRLFAKGRLLRALSMLAIWGLNTIFGLIAAIAGRPDSPLIALFLFPVAACLPAGFGLKTAQFALSGVVSIARLWRCSAASAKPRCSVFRARLCSHCFHIGTIRGGCIPGCNSYISAVVPGTRDGLQDFGVRRIASRGRDLSSLDRSKRFMQDTNANIGSILQANSGNVVC